jgi:Arc/MetJ-type ribon-helix-helix transcriptional regulator
MTLTLNPEIERRIAEQVRLGRFSSAEAVVESAVAELTDSLGQQSLDAEDIAAIQQADAQIDRGEGIDLASFRTRMPERFKWQVIGSAVGIRLIC